ncbi:MAG: DUF1961 family protein [Acidobacteria bacterium]|nr:DUF1961 family protein [Acidobacteriota bacterium]
MRTSLSVFVSGLMQVFAFAAGLSLDDWWVEGGERVWIENRRLHVKADAPRKTTATVFLRRPHESDFRFSVDAQVVSSSANVNNINLFFSTSDPGGRPLIDSAGSRASASYGLYHKLNGYIITFLNDEAGQGGRAPDGSTKSRIRIRRNPGFKLLAETFTYHCKAGVTYRLLVEKTGGNVRFSVDGKELLRAYDAQPLGGGHLGLRTFKTHLWWSNVQLE